MTVAVPHLVLRALSFAARHHQHQKRKDGQTPYIAHPARVMTLVSAVFGETDPEILAAAVLHDTIEDTNADCDDIIREFGERVAMMVAALTKDKRLAETEREERYFAQVVASAPEVKLLKIADILDNLIDIETMRIEKQRSSLPKQIAKAQTALAEFGAEIATRWPRAIEALREQIAIAESAV